MIICKSYSQVDKWLKDNGYFEEGYLLSIEFNPLALTLGYMIKGNFKANSEKEILFYKIIPSKIFEWSYDPSQLTPSQDTMIEEVFPLESELGVGLEFLAPPSFRLITDTFTISDPQILKTTFKPWVDDSLVSIQAPLDAIPTPLFWKKRFQEFGQEILFRYYCGNGMHPEEVPYPNYTGYFFQIADKIAATQYGIFIDYVAKKEKMVTMSFRHYEEAPKTTWNALKTILSDFPEITVHSGNCEFNQKEWKYYLNTGTVPF